MSEENKKNSSWKYHHTGAQEFSQDHYLQEGICPSCFCSPAPSTGPKRHLFLKPHGGLEDPLDAASTQGGCSSERPRCTTTSNPWRLPSGARGRAAPLRELRRKDSPGQQINPLFFVPDTPDYIVYHTCDYKVTATAL